MQWTSRASWTLMLALWLPSAHAQWLEASGDHFVVYSEQPEKQVTGFTERLEQFHAAMAHIFRKTEPPPSASNRVTIYVLPSAEKVREVSSADSRYLAGIYLPRAGATVALVPAIRGTKTAHEMSGETVLYHEYAHHFLHGLSARSHPRWFVEGFAEFFAGVRFEQQGVRLGAPATYRAAELAYAAQVPIRQLLKYDGGASEKKTAGYDAFYGQSWALFHYLFFDPDRAGQLTKYQHLLSTGDSALEAAEGAFGDLDQLARDVDRYVGNRKLKSIVIDRQALGIGSIGVRRLRPAESAMMPIRIESKAGVDKEEALRLVPAARKVAARFTDDSSVWSALAEVEFDAGNLEEAIAAADTAIALDPGDVNAHIQKAYAMYKQAEDTRSEAAWKAARAQVVRANRLEPDHPIPLIRYYLSFLDEGRDVTPASVAGLERAMELAPFDGSLRWTVVNQMIADGRVRQAAVELVPLAYSPHPGEHTDAARKLLQELEAKVDGVDPGDED